MTKVGDIITAGSQIAPNPLDLQPLTELAPRYTFGKYRRKTEDTARMAGNRIERRRTRKKLARKSRQRNRK